MLGVVSEASDAALVRACRNGNEDAWETLVHRYQRFIYSIPRRAGLDEDAAADVFQEVFVALIQGLDKIEDPDRVGAWILTTAKRATWRSMRRRIAARTGQTILDEEAEEVPDIDPLPDSALVDLEEQHEVRTALNGMDERCRQLLTMLFYTHEPPPYGDVAVALGLAEGSIGPIRARCLERLLRRLH
jgi:RNA polymerase sigma factor (sigma-70 family)